MADYVTLEIADVRQETADAVSVAFRVPDELREAFRFKPGQHLPIRTMLAGAEVRRTYSICSGPSDGELRITVKHVPGGLFSNHCNETLRAGARLEVMPPAGRFVVPPGDGGGRHLLAFAAGVGITPIIAMAKHVLETEQSSRFTLVYGNRGAASALFGASLEDLKDRHIGRFTLLNVYSRQSESDTPLLGGRIDAAKIGTLSRSVIRLADVVHVFLCGPGGMIKDARNALMALGYPRERIHHEFFAAGGGAYQTRPAAPAAPAREPIAAAVEITAIVDGVRHRFSMRPDEHVVDAAERAGVRVPFSCRGGMCCTCRCRIVEGTAEMTFNYSLEPWEIAKGFILSCQAKPKSQALMLDYDAL